MGVQLIASGEGKAVDCKKLLANRHSIRDFLDRIVPLSVGEEIIRGTFPVPSARNRQPCRFIFIRDRERIEKLSAERTRNLPADLTRNPGLSLKQCNATLHNSCYSGSGKGSANGVSQREMKGGIQ
jgi:nitroreductase